MASHPPPFQVEDNTDEAFFDELVNDDDNDYQVDHKDTATTSAITSPASGRHNLDANETYDDADSFRNSSINDDGHKEENSWEHQRSNGDTHLHSSRHDEVNWDHHGNNHELLWEQHEHSDEVNWDNHGASDGDNSRFDDTSANMENAEHINQPGNEFGSGKILSDSLSVSETNGGSGIPEVKEVDWSAFNSASAHNDSNGFGSYSDFFGEFGGTDDVGALGNMAKKSPDHVHAQGTDDHSTSWQYNGEYYNAHAADQSSNVYSYDMNMIKQWERQYPGWKYDLNTGEWYEVDGYGIATAVHAEANSNMPTGAVADSQGMSDFVDDWNQAPQGSNAIETTANWNQVIQSSSENNEAQSVWNQAPYYNNGYPPHMVFDPQYPGWYYDTIFMEWRPLESYYASMQSNAQDQGQMNQGNSDSINASAQSTSQVQGSMKHSILEPYNVPSRSTAQVQGQMNSSGYDPNQTRSMSYYYEQRNPGIQPAPGGGSSQAMDIYRGNIQNSNRYWQNISVNTPGSQTKSFSVANPGNQQDSIHYGVKGLYRDNLRQDQNEFSMPSIFDTGGKSIQHFNDSKINQNGQDDFSNDHYSNQNTLYFSKQQVQTAPISYAPPSGRSSDGRPAHALATFGFGGKLIVMKHNNSTENLHFGSQNHAHSVTVLNLVEVVDSSFDPSYHGTSASSYFMALCRQSIPGPLTGGSVGTKELNKWIDERIINLTGYEKAEGLILLLSLLKIACQFYGKFRSPYGTDVELKGSDSPDLLVAKLFASVKRNSSQFSQYGASTLCLQHIPSEGQLQVTAAAVQNLLVSGRKREALQCAQEGQFWGLALVLAAQLSDQFYAETVKKMALHHLAAGSPLRTLCLLIANQPADVFSVDNTAISTMSGAGNMSQKTAQFGANGMLDDWKENLAVIVANRTKDDEFVLIHLGDCLWKERSDIIAAHICYLVADASFEPYSDSARLCLVGADHLKFPRTYACPEAIQRTEIYEYSRTLGNSQFVLLPFQPYKFVYALMLAEVGKMSEAVKYCQAVLKSLKNGRAPEVEALRHLVSSLEERIKAHQQGGFYTNLAPKEFIGKLLKVFDSTAHRVVGGLPPSVPSAGGTFHGAKDQSLGHRVSSSQSTMAMSSLVPSESMEPISELAANSNRKIRHARSVSEPDFGRNQMKEQPDSFKKESSADEQDKSSSSSTTTSFGGLGFGTKLFQKTLGFVLKNRRQAKLGQSNKFYYDEKLKRWVEEGAAPPAEEAALPPPPPTTGVFQNAASDYNSKSALPYEAPLSKGNQESKPPSALDSNSGMPPLPPMSNQYSASGRMGVRSRYVDTFNKGSGNATGTFQSPIIPSAKPVIGANARFFIPTAAATVDNSFDAPPANTSWETTSSTCDYASTSPQHGSSSAQIQRYPSMNSLERIGEGGLFQAHERRTVSWGGNMDQSFSPPPNTAAEVKPLGEVLGLHASSDQSGDCTSTKDGSGDDLQDVEL